MAVLHQVKEGLVAASRGAELIGVSTRHFRRLRRAWEKEGDAVVAHGLRGRPSNRAKPAEVRAWALKRARDALYRGLSDPTLLAETLGTGPQGTGDGGGHHAEAVDDRGRSLGRRSLSGRGTARHDRAGPPSAS